MTDNPRIALALSVAALAAGVLAPAASAAPVLYGATGVDATDTSPPPVSNLYAINPATGAATVIGAIGHSITGMAVDPTSGTLFGVTAGVELAGTERRLLTINTSTGAATVVGSLGTNEIEDIAFDAAGRLYGWNTSADALAEILRTPSVSVRNVGASGAGVTFGGGLAFGVTTTLWGLLNGDDGHLWAIAPASGTAAKSRQLNGSPNRSGATLAAAEFGCDGTTLYSIVNDYGEPPTYLVTVNTVNGDISNRGETVPRLDAIAFGGCETTRFGAPPAAPSAVLDKTKAIVSLLSNARQRLANLRTRGLRFRLNINEPGKIDATLLGRLRSKGARGKARQVAKVSVADAAAGRLTITLRPSAAMRRRLRSERRLPALLKIKVTDAAGNVTTRTKSLTFR